VTLGAARRVLGWLAALPLLGMPAPAADRWEGLRSLREVTIEVDLAVPVPGLARADLERRVAAVLTRLAPPVSADPASADRRRLEVAVRPVSSAELRGFYLPFSGTYGIGPIRLRVERPVVLAGTGRQITAVVWHAERDVAGPWSGAAAAIQTATDALLEGLAQDAGRAAAP
jgi:hypothetical protein